MGLTRFDRYNASGSVVDQVGGVVQAKEPVEDWDDTKREQFALYGSPTCLHKIAWQVSAGGSEYPYDGATPTLPSDHGAADGNATLKLPADVLQTIGTSGLVPGGLLVTFLDGPAVGRVRRIISNSGVTMTVNRNWATAEGVPATGNTFRLLYDLRWMNQFFLTAAYSTSTNVADVIPLLYAWPFTLVGAVAKAGRFPDQIAQIPNLGFQPAALDNYETSYYAGGTYSIETRGAMGAKVRVNAISAGNVSLIAGVS